MSIDLQLDALNQIALDRATLSLTCIVPNDVSGAAALRVSYAQDGGKDQLLRLEPVEGGETFKLIDEVVNVVAGARGRIVAELEGGDSPIANVLVLPNAVSITATPDQLPVRRNVSVPSLPRSNAGRRFPERRPFEVASAVGRDNKRNSGPRSGQIARANTRATIDEKLRKGKETPKSAFSSRRTILSLRPNLIRKPEIIRKVGVRPAAKKLGRSLLMYITTGAALAIGAASTAIYQGYKQGVQDAAEITQDARALAMIPIYAKGTDEVLTYISARPFIQEDVKHWDETAIKRPSNPLIPQEDYMDWNIKPVFPNEVTKGRPFYYTREGLIYGEDRSADGNFGWNPRGFLRAAFSGGRSGGSTLHDQLCGAMWEQTGKFLPKSRVSSHSPDGVSRYTHEVFCGIGLGFGEQMPLDETFANYMTYSYLGESAYGVRNFMDLYWGITSEKDPRFTQGKQLLLASLPKYPIPPRAKGSSHLNKWWKEGIRNAEGKVTRGGVVPRALFLLEGLIEKGIIPAEDQERIKREIHDSDPDFSGLRAKSSFKDSSLAYPNAVAAREIREVVSAQASGWNSLSDWRHDTEAIEMALNLPFQAELPLILSHNLTSLPGAARGTIFVVNEDGEYVGLHTGSSRGFDHQGGRYAMRRLEEPESPGSIGKLMVAAALAAKGLLPNTTYTEKATQYLRASNSLFAGEAEHVLHANPALVDQMLTCYETPGTSHGKQPIDAAVEGNWRVAPNRLPAFLYAIMTGNTLPAPHLLVGEYRRGHTHMTWTYPSNPADATCAQVVYQGGRTREWAKVPLSPGGTLSGIKPPEGSIVIGKTGTTTADTNKDGHGEFRTTNVMWAPFAVSIDGKTYMDVTYIRAEKEDSTTHAGISVDYSKSLGGKLTAQEEAAPLSNDVLQALARHVDD